MADSKISALAALAGTDVDTTADVLVIVDTSVTTDKKILIDELAISMRATQAEIDAGTVANALIAPSTKKVSMLATQAWTGQTVLDFTFPSGVRHITIPVVGTSSDGSSNFLIQLGDAGGIETTGYSAVASLDTGGTRVGSAAGVPITTSNVSTYSWHGTVTLTLVDPATHTWTITSTMAESTATFGCHSAGSKSLSATLTTVRFTTVNGSDTGDAGLVGGSYIL